jgi:hypothetical protein
VVEVGAARVEQRGAAVAPADLRLDLGSVQAPRRLDPVLAVREPQRSPPALPEHDDGRELVTGLHARGVLLDHVVPDAGARVDREVQVVDRDHRHVGGPGAVATSRRLRGGDGRIVSGLPGVDRRGRRTPLWSAPLGPDR